MTKGMGSIRRETARSCCSGWSASSPRHLREGYPMNQEKLTQFVDRAWDDEALPLLVEYIKIPNKSPEFDKDWEKHGYMDQAVELLSGWAKQKIAGMKGATLEVLRLPKRTPLIVIDIPGSAKESEPVLLYGHLDKQPE